MLQRKEEELIKRQTIEKRALPKRIRAERKARDMMFRESLRFVYPETVKSTLHFKFNLMPGYRFTMTPRQKKIRLKR